MFQQRSVVVVLAVSSLALAKSHHHKKGEATTSDQTPQSQPAGDQVDDETRAKWQKTEDEDTRVGKQADKDRGFKRFPDIDIANLSRDGDIWIGGEPSNKGYQQVHDRGVKAIVDVRNPTPKQKDSAREAKRLGMDYLNLPVSPNNMEPEDADIFMKFMKKHEGEQVLIHCGSANRASGMYAVYLGMAKGMPTEEAIAKAKKTGLRDPHLEQDVRDYLNKHQREEQRERRTD